MFEEDTGIDALWEEIKDRKPIRQGTLLGGEEDKYYVAKSEEEVYELSALAYYIWLICDGEHTVGELADRMSREIEVEKNEVIEPLILALNSLARVELVRYT
ncbi:MAG: PqqD family protein [Thermoprotei archaeon]|nr:MAG: PqqD family protein [Thermoprotei archaeon]